MKDLFKDITRIAGGFKFDAVKVSATAEATTFEAFTTDRTVIIKGVAKTPVTDIQGTFGLSNLSTLSGILGLSAMKDENSKITVVENMDFEDVIKKYDSEKTYFYCDPPYYNTENYYANHEFNIDSHERLANCLKESKGMFSLSYYEFPKLSEWFPKDEYVWKQKEFAKAAMAKSGKSQTKGVELLIMNY